MIRKGSNYIILPEIRIILECCRGQMTSTDAINMKKAEVADKSYDPNFNIIVDFQEFETALNSTITDSVADFVNFLKGVQMKCKVALLTSNPMQVVVSEILKKFSDEQLTIEVETFSTLEKALLFIDSSKDNFDQVKGKLIELRKNTA